MVGGVRDFYKKHNNNFWLLAIFPAVLAVVAFLPRIFPENILMLVAGGVCIVLIALHGFFVVASAKDKSKDTEELDREIDFWKEELKMHKWLMCSIKELVTRKIFTYQKQGYLAGEKEHRDAVLKNIKMLHAFYKHYKHELGPDNLMRIVLFEPSEDKKYLISKFYSTENNTPPTSHGKINVQKLDFNKSKSQAVAVNSWRELSTEIAENEDEIHPNYPQQKDHIKSIIAYPVFSGGHVENDLLGILTLTSNIPDFFVRRDIKKHNDYISQFALRINFEYCKLQSTVKERGSNADT